MNTKIEAQDIDIRCLDDYILKASLFTPLNGLKSAVMIGPATGIKRQFYTAFAQHLAEQGHAVISFDNRGIGGSLYGPVKNSPASLQEWGELDMTAVLEELKLRFPATSYHLVGHSAGGQLVGLMSNAHDFSSMFNFACSSGRFKNMRFGYRMFAYLAMNIFLPLSNLVFGHTKMQWLGMGEPLPKRVGQQWSEWCNGQGYVKTAFGKDIHTHLYDELNFPSMWLNAVDDDIAINENVEDMIKVFKQLPAETLSLDPKEYDLTEIGHMKFFSRKNKKLWSIATEWLGKYS